MSLLTTICKIFSFLVKVFTAIVRAVAAVVKEVAKAVVDVLDVVVSGVGKAVFGNFGIYALIGLGAYFLLTKDDDSGKTVVIPSGVRNAEAN